MLALLIALQHADSSFPGGAFAFSSGMEALSAAVDLDAPGVRAAVGMSLRHRWAPCDRIAVALSGRAKGDHARLSALDEAIEAATFSETLRQGSQRQGAALLTAHARLGTPGATPMLEAVRAGALLGHVPVVQGALWRQLGMDEAVAVHVSGYLCAAGLVAASVRLGSLGALAAQAILAGALPLIQELAAAPMPPDAQIGGYMPWLDTACARYAHAGSRLFAS